MLDFFDDSSGLVDTVDDAIKDSVLDELSKPNASYSISIDSSIDDELGRMDDALVEDVDVSELFVEG